MTTAPAPRPRSRAVMWIGLVLGTALAALAMSDGVRLRIGGVPSFLGWILGGAIVWLLVIFSTAGVAELLRRHHRPMRQFATRQAGRGLRWAGRNARHHGGRGLAATGGWINDRWTTRQTSPQPGPTRPPVSLGTLLRPSRWRRPGRDQQAGGTYFTDPAPTPPDGLPAAGPGPQRTGTSAPPPGSGGVTTIADGAEGRPLHMPDEDDGTEWSDPEPEADYGPGPWMLAVRRKNGQPYYDAPFSPAVGTATVYDGPDLKRRLAAAADDPGLAVRVIPLKLTDPDLAGPLDPALEQDIRRQVCERYTADEIEPGEVIVHPDGAITIDRRRNSRGRYPRVTPLTGVVRWARQPDGTARVASLYPPPTDSAGGAVPSADSPNQHGGSMTTAADTTFAAPYYGPSRRPGRTAIAPEANGTWQPLIGSTHDFEPENDSHLLGWMAGEAGGMTGYAEAIQDAYETSVNTVGLDPVAMQALHDYADAAAGAAEAMAAARQRFADHYSEVRQFAANGGVLPYNGRWMTGEGD